MIAVDSIRHALPAVIGSFGRRGLVLLGVRFDRGLGLISRLGQNSMVMRVCSFASGNEKCPKQHEATWGFGDLLSMFAA